MSEAHAAIVLTDGKSTDADKIAAIAVIRDRGDQDALSLLDSVAANQSPQVRAAVAAARGKIQSSLAIWNTVQNAWYGLSLGSVLLLAAIGLAITFGVMGVINMAHGEMVMLGAYTTFVVQDAHPRAQSGAVRLLAGDRGAAGVHRRGRRRHHHRAHASSVSSTAGRWKRCSPPGACR